MRWQYPGITHPLLTCFPTPLPFLFPPLPLLPSQINYLLLNVVPVLVTVVAFSAYALLGNEMTAAKAFTSISLFSVLRFPLYTFPQLITQVRCNTVTTC